MNLLKVELLLSCGHKTHETIASEAEKPKVGEPALCEVCARNSPRKLTELTPLESIAYLRAITDVGDSWIETKESYYQPALITEVHNG